ncbi:MAG TPA: hypothetical protein VIH53_00015 [Gemmatimonadaceae bacterium]
MITIAPGRTFVQAGRIAALLLCCGCQHYIDLGPAAPVPTGTARLTLSDHGSALSYGAIGASVRQVEGKITSFDDTVIAIAATSVVRQNGFEETWPGATVSIPRRDVTRIESKSLSVPRTFAALGGLIAGSIAVSGAISNGEATSSSLKKPGSGN